MLTIEERMHMYKGKKLFIDHISKVFEDEYLQSNVVKVDYEVYMKPIDDETTYYTEFAVVTFVGGGKSVRTISGNSNNANFQEIGKLINGGYYDELEYYERVKANSIELKLEELHK
jgi:hypothetical protein